MFELRPIKPLYTDDEIKLSRTLPNMKTISYVKGTASFNSDYTKVTIDIQFENGDQFEPFVGNGTYHINEDD